MTVQIQRQHQHRNEFGPPGCYRSHRVTLMCGSNERRVREVTALEGAVNSVLLQEALHCCRRQTQHKEETLPCQDQDRQQRADGAGLASILAVAIKKCERATGSETRVAMAVT